MDIYYQQKYIKYKCKYNILGGAFKKKGENSKIKEKAENRKIKEKAEKDKIEKKIKDFKAWEKITQTELFLAEIEMIITTQEDISVDQAIKIVKTTIIENELVRQQYYAIPSIQEAMDYLQLKPSTEIYMSASIDSSASNLDSLEEDDFM